LSSEYAAVGPTNENAFGATIPSAIYQANKSAELATFGTAIRRAVYAAINPAN